MHPLVWRTSSYDSSEVYSSALDTATQLRTAAALMRNVASRATPQNAQQVRARGPLRMPRRRTARLGSLPLLRVCDLVAPQDVLNTVMDVLEKYLLLFQAARDQIRDPRNADARVRVRNLADSVSNALAALQYVFFFRLCERAAWALNAARQTPPRVAGPSSPASAMSSSPFRPSRRRCRSSSRTWPPAASVRVLGLALSVRPRAGLGPASGRARACVGQGSGLRRAGLGPASGRAQACVGQGSGLRRAGLGPASGRARACIGRARACVGQGSGLRRGRARGDCDAWLLTWT